MTVPVPDADSFPSMEKIVLPSRAFLLSWREQTIPARRLALEDAVSYFDELPDPDDLAVRDMALLWVIGEATQPLEDLAYLAEAWSRPWQGLARYVRATSYSSRVPTNFWQEAARWPESQLELLAGFSGVDPNSGEVSSFVEGLNMKTPLGPDVVEAMEAARLATIARLRRVLAMLGGDWKMFGVYFHAYKHGALAVSREDTVAVEDDVEEITPETRVFQPTIAVWPRRKEDSVAGEFDLPADEVAKMVAGSGRLAIDLVDAFVEARLPLFDALDLSDEGELVGLRPMQIPLTIWLREQDLDERHWKVLGHGPTVRWRDEDEPEGSTLV